MLELSNNYFELFGLPQAFPLDGAALAERYRELQRVMHPDRFAAASDLERRLAVQGAALINQAHETLKNPMLRARYLLSLLGVEMDELGETTHDSAFLMEQMELRETLEEATHQPDPYAVTVELRQRVEQSLQQRVARVALLFEQPDEAHLQQVREEIRKMQFLQKLRRDIEAMEERLDS